MKTSKIKTFSIFGLWGEKDIRIPFEDDVKILVGDNGIGKSQVLSIIYHTLSGKWAGLTKYIFECLEIEGEGEERIVVTKWDVWEKLHVESAKRLQASFPNLSIMQVQQEKDKVKNSCYTGIREELYFHLENILKEEDTAKDFQISAPYLSGYTKDMFINNTAPTINELFPNYSFLYLPTFRRIEENLSEIIKIGYTSENSYSKVKTYTYSQYINFSLEDVEKKIESLESQIDNIMKAEFPLLSNKMLKSLINGNGNKQEYDFTAEDVELSLHRTKDFLSEEEKNKIRELALNPNSEAAQKEKHTLDFLQQLVYLYRKQQPFDAAIKKWQSVCNRYMTDKEIVYDETLVKVELQTKKGKVLSLNQLSSGEKQLIGLFSQLYLSEGEQKYAIIFDEPEISMSVFWQENLLNDMLASGKCGFLLVATHSPFIFSGDLAKYAIGLHEYITPISPVHA